MPVTLTRMISTALSNMWTPRKSRTQWCQRTGPQIVVFTLISLPRRAVWMTVALTCMVLPMTGQRSHLPFTTQHTEPTCLLSHLIKVRRHIREERCAWRLITFRQIQMRVGLKRLTSLSIRTLDGLMGWNPGGQTGLLHPDPKHQFTSCILSPPAVRLVHTQM